MAFGIINLLHDLTKCDTVGSLVQTSLLCGGFRGSNTCSVIARVASPSFFGDEKMIFEMTAVEILDNTVRWRTYTNSHAKANQFRKSIVG